MIKYKNLPANIEDLIPKALAYLQSMPDILFAYLFGSFGRGKQLPLSDVDIAVYLKDPTVIQKKKLEILGALIDILQTDEIDLVVLNNAPLPLRMRILENKKVVVDRDPFLRHHYESLTMREYFDFSILEKQILNRRFLSG
jgi:predicted nucleotidyltransferase